MSLIFATRRNLLQIKGLAHQLQSLNQKNGKFDPIVSIACFRTGGLGKDTPHETPPMRQNTSTLDAQLDLETATSADCGPIVNPSAMLNDEELAPIVKHKHNHHGLKTNETFEKALLKTLTFATSVYDTITLPIYAAAQPVKPWTKLALHNAPKGILMDKEKQIYKSATPIGSFHSQMVESGIDTMEKVYSFAVSKNGDKKCLGAREVIGESEMLDQQTLKMMRKYELGNYKWLTYKDCDEIAKSLSFGFASLGMNPKNKVAIFAETRQEWLLATMGAFKRNLKLITVFTTLGDDGVIHALNETQAPCLITSEELMPRIENILKHCPSIKSVIYMDNKDQKPLDPRNFPSDVKLISFNGLVEQGRQNPVEEIHPTKDDEAIIMYTSGSTGTPKGVILSHSNLVAGIKSVLDVLEMHDTAKNDDKYIAYLPLAHVLEMMSEAICFIQGIPIGYSSPLTLTDQSLAIMPGSKGDASILKPTIMAGVPLVLERVCKGIHTKIAEKGRIAQLLFDFFCKYKTKWTLKGYETPLVNKIFFEKIRQVLGGRVRFMAIGSAPLAPETHEFIRNVFCCPICLGYAMTESSSCGTFATAHDLSIGRVGPPVHSNHVRLVNWEEGGYRTTDKPYPRGEIVLGGDNIALGYYKLRESTDFFEEDGRRWIQTGDIGEVHPDGAFKIIDRKKDLVKLSMGEYISLGKIEAVIKSSVVVENACVCADSTHSYPVVLVVPAQNSVLKLADEMDIPFDSYTALCRDPRIVSAVLEEIQETGRELNLNKFEIPRKIFLCPEPWLPTGGLVTAAFKIRRINVYKHYEREIEQMYNSSS